MTKMEPPTLSHLAQTQRGDAIAKLTGGVAHDFNNLLQVIVTNLHFLEEDLAPDDACREMVDFALEAADRGAEVTHRLLAYTQQQMLTPEETDLNKLIGDVTALLRSSLGEMIEIETRLAAGEPMSKIDPGHMQNALVNLAVNARDAMPDGGKLTFVTEELHFDEESAASHDDMEAGDYVMIAAHDSGCGIVAETLERVFEPYFTTKGLATNHGLGLSMVYGFARQSGGRAEIESEIGVGTSVRIYLPRAAGVEKRDHKKVPAKDGLRGNETILLVEESPQVLATLEHSLRRLGYTVLSAQNGPKAMSILEGREVDLIVTDMVMPKGMTGRELARRARANHPDLAVIFVTGYAEAAAQHAQNQEPGLLLRKPFVPERLAQAVRQSLDG